MRWDVLGFTQFSKSELGLVEKSKKDQTLNKNSEEFFKLSGSNKPLISDEFSLQFTHTTNPFYTANSSIQKFIPPFIKKQAVSSQPVSSIGLLQDSCLVGNIARSFLTTLEIKDSYTKSHSQAVNRYSKALAQDLNLSSSEIELINVASVFHDIGKIGVPETILHKPSKLTDEEYEIIKKHPENGSKILENIPTFNGHICDIVKCHHENWDGSGYPNGLSKKNIPLGARIVAIADTYHAMTSDRPYRKGLPQEEAIRRLQAGAGTQFDPTLTSKFINIIS